jgi:uncharacterized repeat protein (TIGR01451 family)
MERTTRRWTSRTIGILAFFALLALVAAPATAQEPGDLRVKKDPDKASVMAGEAAGFRIVVINDGPGTMHNVRLRDLLPRTDLDWFISGSQPTCTLTDEGGRTRLDCAIGTLAPGQFFQIRVKAFTDERHCGPLKNTARASGDIERAIHLDNNVDDGEVQVVC